MNIVKKENKIKQEICINVIGILNKDNIKKFYDELNSCARSNEWEKITIDFSEVSDIDIDAVKVLWKIKEITNSLQKTLEIVGMKTKVAVMLKFLGFTEYFNTEINCDENVINSVKGIGEYGEPLYEDSNNENENLFIGKKITKNDIYNCIKELIEKYEIEIKEWNVIIDDCKNKLIFLIESENYIEIEEFEKYIYETLINNYDILSSMYRLETGSYDDYINYKIKIGVPIKYIKIPKFVKNPYDKKYFLNKIDERY